MDRIEISRDDLEEFKRLQIRHRWDWPAVFSTNCHGEIWPFVQYGYTPGPNREDVRGLSRLLDEVADEYLRFRNSGGRFFIDDRGAFYKDQASQEIQFLRTRTSLLTVNANRTTGGKKTAISLEELQRAFAKR